MSADVSSDTGYFAQVPEWVMDAVSGNAVKLYAILRRYADYATNEAHPSRRTLANRMGFSRPASVDPLVQELVDAKALEVFERWAGPGDRDSNGYRVLSAKPEGVVRQSGPQVVRESAPRVVRETVHKQEPLEREPVERENSLSRVASDDDGGVSDEARRLCDLLAELVTANGHKVGVVGKQWWMAADRLMRLDEYTAEQVETIIRWATADEFWSANIRSMPKLREKFSTLRARRNAEIERRRPSLVEHGRTVDQMLADREAGQQLAVTS